MSCFTEGMWLWVTIAVALDGALVLVGALIPEHWLERYRAPMLGFAAGALLATGVHELLPEVMALEGLLGLGLAAGAMIVLGVIALMSKRRASHRSPVLPAALLTSDGLHNLGDGVAIAAAFLVDIKLGVTTSAAVMLHELPEEIADYALLRAVGMQRTRALLALVAVQLTAGIGAAGVLLASSLVTRAQGGLLAIASGLFLYIALVDLLPAMWRARSLPAFAAMAFGATVVLLA